MKKPKKAYSPVLSNDARYLSEEGGYESTYQWLGAHPLKWQGQDGVLFVVWAPNALSVAVAGSFNDWDSNGHAMHEHTASGLWELFVPGLAVGALYKYEIYATNHTLLPLKADPYAFAMQHPPETASMVWSMDSYQWQDEAWMESRSERTPRNEAVAIYEVHLASWKRVAEEDNRYLTYHELADQLIPYVKELGFTHLQLMPVSEYPFDGSWGYQPIGLFAPTSRFGSPDDFKYFVDRCHQADLAVLLDWVPGHFPTDQHGLGRFDGTCLYEHQDKRRGFHPDWNTLIYDYGRKEVITFLISNALFWLDQYHIDGLRVDAVASMLYLDYSRKEGEWFPNTHGGRENLEAIDLLQKINEQAFGNYPMVTTIAEESTAWPGVSHPTYSGGLGFGYKWNMGWMHDTLQYMSRDPVHRKYHHNDIKFGLEYAFSENFILPLSHDEVVHGKGSLLTRMPGDDEQAFANLRAYFGFMWTHPGKKLLFMGGEFAQRREWNHDTQLDWQLLDNKPHAGMRRLVKDLNGLYQDTPALHQQDCEASGFEWIEVGDHAQSVYAYLRKSATAAAPVIVVCNFTPQPRDDYRVGVPDLGTYKQCFNTDAKIYGGSGRGNRRGIKAERVISQGRPFSMSFRLPPMTTLVLQRVD